MIGMIGWLVPSFCLIEEGSYVCVQSEQQVEKRKQELKVNRSATIL